MSYHVLARKYRPKSFAELKGQEHVTKALAAAISRNAIHHAFLFTGTRGVGKTSIARILAKCLNCEQGVLPQPCGQCRACQDIDSGRFVDLIEVDGASRTRVEDTKELLENVQYAPTQGRYKIYLIDEVHMLSMHSFNALLKTLEEPPAHVKFILATTSPERIPVTILSRCLRFTLRALAIDEIIAQLKEILTVENITFEEQGLKHIAKAAQGSVRDSLSILEQAIAYGDQGVTNQAVEEMLAITYFSQLPHLLEAIIKKDMQATLEIVKQMDTQAADFNQVLTSIIEALHAYAIKQVVSTNVEHLVDFELPPLEASISPEELQLMYQIALMGHKEMQLAPIARLGFEMTLLKMLVFRPQQDAIEPPKPVASKPVPTKPMMASVRPAVAPVSKPTSSQSNSVVLQKTQNNDSALNWAELIKALPLTGLTRILVQHCVLSHWDGQNMTITLDEMQKACLNPQRQTQIQEALAQYLQKPVKLTILTAKIEGNTPMQEVEAQRTQKEQQVKASIQEDKMIQNMISTFDAKVEVLKIEE